jgi:mediator of RNA polymerase II transcription subunit 16
LSVRRHSLNQDQKFTDLTFNRGMAWSKWGCLASITADCRGLEFRNLRAHPRDGSWGMSEANVLPMVTPALDGGPLKHLCWSSNGSDLAVIDSAGRIAILTTGNFINKPNFTRSSQMDPIDELHSIVGAHWLNILPSHIRPVRKLQKLLVEES